MASPTIEASSSTAPPSYPQATIKPDQNTGTGIRETARIVAPVPFFDSILRAAPEFDNEEDFEEDDFGSPSSSTLSLAGQLNLSDVSHWSLAIVPHLQQHASLHAYLDANATLQENLVQLRERIHVNAGKTTSLLTKITRLQKRLHELQLESDKKVKLFWSPKRKKEFLRQAHEASSEIQSIKETLHKYEEQLSQDREEVRESEARLEEYVRVDARLDAIDDEVFGGPTHDHEEENELEQQYHILTETVKRLQTTINKETRCQVHLTKAHQLCVVLIKELLAGLHIGIEIGVPTNQKHKTALWKGSSPTHSANRSRSHVLRAKTVCGDLHTQYILARGVQRRVALLTKLKVIEVNRLPGMNASNGVNEAGLHRSLEQSYAQAKCAKAHIEIQQRLSRERQACIKKHIKELQKAARSTWLELRKRRREIVEEYRKEHGTQNREEKETLYSSNTDRLPPYKRNLISTSMVALGHKDRSGAISLPMAFRRRVDKESMAKSKLIVRQAAIEVGGIIEDDNVADHEYLWEEEDLPGVELGFGYNK